MREAHSLTDILTLTARLSRSMSCVGLQPLLQSPLLLPRESNVYNVVSTTIGIREKANSPVNRRSSPRARRSLHDYLAAGRTHGTSFRCSWTNGVSWRNSAVASVFTKPILIRLLDAERAQTATKVYSWPPAMLNARQGLPDGILSPLDFSLRSRLSCLASRLARSMILTFLLLSLLVIMLAEYRYSL